MSNKRSHVQLFNPPAEKYYARKRVNEPLRVPVAPPCAPLRQDRRTPDAPTAPRCHDGVSGDSNGGREEEEGEEEGGKEEGGRRERRILTHPLLEVCQFLLARSGRRQWQYLEITQRKREGNAPSVTPPSIPPQIKKLLRSQNESKKEKENFHPSSL